MPELCAAYSLPQGQSGTGTIAIVELGGGWLQSDVTNAFAAMGLPAPQITDVSVDGTQNTPDPGDPANGEVALDIQVAGAVYAYMTGKPAKIRMYWAQDIASAVKVAAKDGCAVCSISWGASESNWGPAALDEMEGAALAATQAGMTVFAASGDNDADDGGGIAAVDAPASCPHVVGCGGTHNAPDSEGVWNNDPGQATGEGTGGGFSEHFPPQSWQSGIPTAPDGLGRMVPDVAANADPLTGYMILLEGQWEPVGGTSAVAPFYAGFFAGAATKPLGFITPMLWANPQEFNYDIEGNNGPFPFQAQPPCPGPCTGLGSPKGSALAALFAAAPATAPAPSA